ncbi:hypothetical protein [Pseudomonas sp. Z4-7]|uniref:hypothetical protein n=1 Tax=Pseudomonas sp. Z4-7 TaxID=2817413 RepID=UPI003DAA444B
MFAKSCELTDAIIDYHNPTGYIPTELLSAYGAFTLLGGREVNESGCVPLEKISGTLPASIGTLALGGTALASLSAGAAVTAPLAAGALAGLVGLLMPSNLADGSLYTEEQLRSLEQARTRVRLHVETQADGTLKRNNGLKSSNHIFDMPWICRSMTIRYLLIIRTLDGV